MVDRQLVARGISDERVLAAMREIPRHRFVPASRLSMSYSDRPVPIGSGQTISQPYIVGLMTQALELTRQETVLEIGTGSGYVTALLAASAASVVSVEIYSALSLQAGARLQSAGFDTVDLKIGDGAAGWPGAALYDAIIITGSVPQLPTPFVEALAPGGRLVAIIGEAPAMEALLYHKTNAGLLMTSLFDTVLPPLVNTPKKESFIF